MSTSQGLAIYVLVIDLVMTLNDYKYQAKY